VVLVDVVAKLQLKPGMTIAVVGVPDGFDVVLPEGEVTTAEAMLAFSSDRAALEQLMPRLQESARAGRLTWIAYPKAGKLGTDLNRDSLRESVLPHGLDTVRQVAVDDTWSAMRLKASREPAL
jgi:hypothetical protein